MNVPRLPVFLFQDPVPTQGRYVDIIAKQGYREGRAAIYISLTRRDFNVGAVPELLGVSVPVAAHTHTQRDPVRRVGGALAAPRRRVELVVSRVPARVASVCTPLCRREQDPCPRSRGGGEGGVLIC